MRAMKVGNTPPATAAASVAAAAVSAASPSPLNPSATNAPRHCPGCPVPHARVLSYPYSARPPGVESTLVPSPGAGGEPEKRVREAAALQVGEADERVGAAACRGGMRVLTAGGLERVR
jgi:hypothetical protein